MLGTGLGAETVVIILEFILAVYSAALVVCTKNKILRIVHVVLGVFWVVLALLNIFM